MGTNQIKLASAAEYAITRSYVRSACRVSDMGKMTILASNCTNWSIYMHEHVALS